MLELNGEPFSCGRSRFFVSDPDRRESTARIFVRVQLGDLETLARLDTGSPWSVMDADFASVVGVRSGLGIETTMSTVYGTITGPLEKVPITLLAEEGRSLEIDSTFLIPRLGNGGMGFTWDIWDSCRRSGLPLIQPATRFFSASHRSSRGPSVSRKPGRLQAA